MGREQEEEEGERRRRKRRRRKKKEKEEDEESKRVLGFHGWSRLYSDVKFGATLTARHVSTDSLCRHTFLVIIRMETDGVMLNVSSKSSVTKKDKCYTEDTVKHTVLIS